MNVTENCHESNEHTGVEKSFVQSMHKSNGERNGKLKKHVNSTNTC